MKNIYHISEHLASRLNFAIVLLFITLTAFPQETINTNAKHYALSFFNSLENTRNLKSAISENSVTECYQSDEKVNTPLYVFQAGNNGFAIIAQSHNSFKIVGYSDKGTFDKNDMPPQLKALMHYYEDSLQFANTANTANLKSSVVVSPLLDEYGIKLNQYHHPEVGGSVTGCMATAVTQIMLFHSKEQNKPIKGFGSHCYTYEPYGDICADFENSDYSDLQLLSYHVAISMDMRFTSEGSSPPTGELKGTIDKYFHFFVAKGINEIFYIKSELDNRRPVYAAVYGIPEGHAIVIDGYDDRGYMHFNFGWGGNYNGYYLPNNGWLGVGGVKLSTFFNPVYVISSSPISVNQQDSLALVAIHNALGGYEATKWDLTKPVWDWQGVTIMNGRVIQLNINSQAPPATEQSIPDEIGNLTELRDLFLSGPLNGTIPTSITNLTNLRNLSIQNTTLYKDSHLYKGNMKSLLPETIDNLSNLQMLSVSNALTGNIPTQTGNLKNITSLVINQDTANFGRGELSGSLPSELGNLTKLSQLTISGQKLSGTIPDIFDNLTSLSGIDLSDNELTGVISTVNSASISYIDLNHNHLSGFGEGTWNCSALEHLDMNNNEIEGDIPEWFGSFSSLKYLNLSDNKVTSLPESFGGLISLESLLIDNNQLASLPEGITLLQKLSKLSAPNNNISHLPEGLGQTRSLTSINLAQNKINNIPEFLCSCPDISEVFLNNNNIDSIPGTFANLPDNFDLYLQNNEISGKIPETLLSSINFVRLDSNRFVFCDIPESDKLRFGLHKQKKIPVKKNLFNVQMGDTVTIDIRNITNLSDTDNEYYWFVYPDYEERPSITAEMKNIENNPVLKIPVNEQTLHNAYYCKVFNPNVKTYSYTYNGYNYTSPVLEYLNTDTVAFSLATDQEILEERYPEKYVTTLEKITGSTVTDKTVTLVPPVKVKWGDVIWEASADGNTWEIVSDEMQSADIKSNIVSANKDELILSPKKTAFYRCCIYQENCDTLYSDKLKVEALGNVLYDDILNVTEEPVTISVDSIEVTVPQNFHDSDFRLTITKMANPPSAPDSVKLGSVYEVSVDFGSSFNIPLLIKLKNIDKSKVEEKDIDKFKAVYFDDLERRWKLFDNFHLSMKDSSMLFTTSHLTKLSYWWDEESVWGYTDVYVRNNIRVFYKDEDIQYMKFIYGKKQTAQSWHIEGIPIMVQDITEYLDKVRKKYKALGLEGPDGKFNVYVRHQDDSGCVGLLGMLNGYMTINVEMPSPTKLKKVLAHEFMHYTQDYYIAANPGNSFWMEAHASASDRLVWDATEVPVCESEVTLTEAKTSKNSIFTFISNSWDYWDKSFFTNNFSGNIYYDYIAGTFLHYMQECRKSSGKLDVAELLKETNWFGSWRGYLADFIKNNIVSDMGLEYEDYIKYILSGVNENFSLLNHKGDPYSFIKDVKNKNVFTYPITYSFKKNDDPQTDDMSITVPYLAAKVVLTENLSTDTLVVVNYKRNHTANDDHLVYYVSYNPESKNMDYVNITDSAEFNFILEPRNKQNIEKGYKNYGMILLINKEYDKSAGDFKASFKLTATPVFNIESVRMLDIYNGEYPIKHNFDNNTTDYVSVGTPSAEYWQNVTGFDAKETDNNVTRYIDGDTLKVTSRFTMIVDEGEIKGKPTIKDSTIHIQTIKYNLLSGLLQFTEDEIKYHKYHTYIEFVQNANGEVIGENTVYNAYTAEIAKKTRTYYLRNFSDYVQPENITKGFETSYGDNIAVILTNNTTETQNVVEKIDARYITTSYSEDGTAGATTESKYTGTDFSNPNLKLYFVVKTE